MPPVFDVVLNQPSIEKAPGSLTWFVELMNPVEPSKAVAVSVVSPAIGPVGTAPGSAPAVS
jgi:hypothetical protein